MGMASAMSSEEGLWLFVNEGLSWVRVILSISLFLGQAVVFKRETFWKPVQPKDSRVPVGVPGWTRSGGLATEHRLCLRSLPACLQVLNLFQDDFLVVMTTWQEREQQVWDRWCCWEACFPKDRRPLLQ